MREITCQIQFIFLYIVAPTRHKRHTSQDDESSSTTATESQPGNATVETTESDQTMTLTKSPDNTMTHSSPTGTPAVSTHVPSAKKKQNSTPETKMRPTQRSTPQKHIDSNQPKLSETVASSEDGEIPCLQTIKKIPKKNVTGFKNPGMIRLNSSVDFDHEPEPVEHDTEPVDPETVPTVNPPGQNATTSEPFIDLTGQGTQEAELRPADRLSHSQNDDGEL